MNVHIVQKGDTLWKIARQNGVSFEELKRMNAHLANPDYIVPGMKIFLPDKAVGKKEEIVHPFHDGRPPKTVVLPEKEVVVAAPVMEMPSKKEVVKEVVVEAPPPAPVQPTPIVQYQPVQMPHYHAIQYVPITKNFYSVQQSAHVEQPAPVQPPPVVMPKESPMIEEIVEEHVEPMEVPMMVQPCFTGPMCGCHPMYFDCCMPMMPCSPFMHSLPMGPVPMPYYDGYPMMPGMMPGMMAAPMVEGAVSPGYGPTYMPAQQPAYYQPTMMEEPAEMMPMMEPAPLETHEVAGQMAVNTPTAGWILESSSDEPSSFLEKFEHHYAPATGVAPGAYAPQPGEVAGAYAPQMAPIMPDYYSYQQPVYPTMAAAPYGNPYMMPYGYGYGAGPCQCY